MNTPTPWIFDKYGNIHGNILQEGTDSFTSQVPVEGVALCSSKEAKANTALIVRAVNAHQALVDALESIKRCATGDGNGSTLDEISRDFCHIRETADAALKLARGES